MKQNDMQPITRRRIVELARELKADFGARLTLRAFCRETGLPPTLVVSVCGSWDRVRSAIGLAHRTPTRSRLSNARIRELLRKHSAERNGRLTQWEFCRLTGIDRADLGRRFGSWGNLCESVGLPPRKTQPAIYTEDDIEQDMLQVYLRVGRCPTQHQYRLFGGQISATALRARYNTWKGVRIRFELMKRRYHQRAEADAPTP